MTESREKQRELDDVLGALAHESRRHILLVAWFRGGTMSAGEIAGRFGHAWPTTSRHLRVLEQAGLLQFEKRGRTRVYRVNADRLQIARDWLRWFEQPREQVGEPESGPTVPSAPESVLAKIALAYPEAVETASEAERIIKVRSRPFVLLRANQEGLRVMVKLAASRATALEQPFVEPVRYRIGKSDWIAAGFALADELPIELLWEWIDESYRLIAPRRLLAQLPAPPAAPRPAD
jgi:DNA-binding transcriptional ArsR family regulator